MPQLLQPRRPRAKTSADQPVEPGLSTAARGAACEALAWQHLQASGYTLVGRQVRVKGGELDLIARDGEVLCFIEVRSRASAAQGHPLETIDAAKQQRIARAAALWLADHPHPGPCRFDAVGIVTEPEPEITLVRGAFVPTRVF